MSWNNIEDKLNNHEYWDIQSFKARADIQVVLDNTVLSSSHKMVQAQAALVDLDQLSSLRSTNETNRAAHSIGDLGPPLEILELLVCPKIEDGPGGISANPIASLFDFELESKGLNKIPT
ncbi:hypothetical protein B0H14DRAFT_2564445 [Mycena olivaceomarginata]|nr:hypothetical protein B0H14DRAFT_2564445 [Mycena olivaceomarginata]